MRIQRAIRQKYLLLLAVLTLLTAIIYFGARPSRDLGKGSLLSSSLSSAISLHQSGELPVVDLSEITQFSWDKVYFFGPYTGSLDIYATLGFPWFESRFTQIDSSDSITLIVFVRDWRVVDYVEFPRVPADFAYLDNNSGYIAANAKFVLNETGRMVWVGDK